MFRQVNLLYRNLYFYVIPAKAGIQYSASRSITLWLKVLFSLIQYHEYHGRLRKTGMELIQRCLKHLGKGRFYDLI